MSSFVLFSILRNLFYLIEYDSRSRPLTCVLSQLQRTEQQTTRQKEKRL